MVNQHVREHPAFGVADEEREREREIDRQNARTPEEGREIGVREGGVTGVRGWFDEQGARSETMHRAVSYARFCRDE